MPKSQVETLQTAPSRTRWRQHFYLNRSSLYHNRENEKPYSFRQIQTPLRSMYPSFKIRGRSRFGYFSPFQQDYFFDFHYSWKKWLEAQNLTFLGSVFIFFRAPVPGKFRVSAPKTIWSCFIPTPTACIIGQACVYAIQGPTNLCSVWWQRPGRLGTCHLHAESQGDYHLNVGGISLLCNTAFYGRKCRIDDRVG